MCIVYLSVLTLPPPKYLAAFSLQLMTNGVFLPQSETHLYHDEVFYIHVFVLEFLLGSIIGLFSYLCCFAVIISTSPAYLIFGRVSHLFFQIEFKIVLSSSKNNIKKESKNIPVIIDINIKIKLYKYDRYIWM